MDKTEYSYKTINGLNYIKLISCLVAFHELMLTKIEAVNKNKKRAFILFQKDISQFKIKVWTLLIN